ncbi:MAG: Fic family protein [Christensenellaceae bacterium]|jgi:Fic family protein|nr:Fic family protein [Christensenellaceae bacterium]
MRIFNYELLKRLSIDTETLSLISEIKELKGKQNFFMGQKKDSLAELVEIAKIQSTEASNKIEGIITTEKRIKELFKEKTAPKNRDEEEIIGYRDVLNTIHENFEGIPLKPNYILQLHKDLFKYTAGSIGGKFKSVDNYIQEIDENGNKFIRFKPLEAFLTPAAVADICDEYEKALNSYLIEPLLLIPIFLLDFLCIHPFTDGNGRMSRLLTLMLLYKNEFIVGKYISIERMIEKTKSSYYESLRQSSDKWLDNKNDPMPFIKYMLKIILAAYREFEERVVIFDEKKLGKGERIKELFANHLGKLSKSKIQEFLPDISQPMIEKTLRDLVKSGYIKKTGQGKNSAYIRNN